MLSKYDHFCKYPEGGGIHTYRSEERLLDLLSEDVEHVNGLGSEGQVGARHPLILSQLGLAALLLLLKEGGGNTSRYFFHRQLACVKTAEIGNFKKNLCTNRTFCNIPKSGLVIPKMVRPL